MGQRTIAGRYEITSPIGRGGMGEVWAGYDKRLDRTVAVKLLRPEALPEGSKGRTAARRFAREARLTARIEHPGVPAVYDAGTDAEQLYLVMQLVPGVDLVDFLAEREWLSVRSAASIAAQVASVLAAAHAVSLVHRDLKPSNVMIRPDGAVSVLDFGIAAWLNADITRLTSTGEAVGSPAYMSPEQVLGGVPSPRSDLYALGCILHELLAGARPFAGEASYLAMRAHVEEPPPPLRTVCADAPEALEHLVADLLAKAPEERPADAQEVYDRLLPFVPAPGGSSSVVDEPDPTKPFRRPLAPRARAAPAAVKKPAQEVQSLAQARDQAANLALDGRLTQAADLLRRVLGEMPRDARGKDQRDVRLQLANTLFLGSDYAYALAEYEHLLADTDPSHADDDDVLHWRIQAATCHAAMGDPAEALRQLEPALEIKRSQKGATDDEVVMLRRQVVLLHASSGSTEAARSSLRELMSDLGPTHDQFDELSDLASRLRTKQ